MANPAEPLEFDSVASNLRRTYPEDKMQDISTTFRFVYLLHPAKDRRSRIEVGEGSGVEAERQRKGITRLDFFWVSRYILFVFLPPLLLSLDN